MKEFEVSIDDYFQNVHYDHVIVNIWNTPHESQCQREGCAFMGQKQGTGTHILYVCRPPNFFTAGLSTYYEHPHSQGLLHHWEDRVSLCEATSHGPEIFLIDRRRRGSTEE